MAIKIYTACRMTGRFKDELVAEANMLCDALKARGFEPLNPVLEEKVESTHELLAGVDPIVLEHYWRRDKQMIRDADIVLDYQTQNKSDGANKEVGYSRWCLWKPTVRVWDGGGALISRIEDDLVVPTLQEALDLIESQWGTYEKLGAWREEMGARSFTKWLSHQQELNKRYSVKGEWLSTGK